MYKPVCFMKNIDTSFFRVSTDKLPVEAGNLLVADPFLSEMWFERGVISIIDHNPEEGTTGVVLNNALESGLDEVLDGICREDKVPVYCGGPLSQDRLFFVHTLGETIIPQARCYAPGLWIGGDFDSAIEYVNNGYPVEGYLRFFVGYSGGSAGQLDDELAAGTWAVKRELDEVIPLLAGCGDPYWHRVVHSMGERYRQWTLLPQDVKAN